MRTLGLDGLRFRSIGFGEEVFDNFKFIDNPSFFGSPPFKVQILLLLVVLDLYHNKQFQAALKRSQCCEISEVLWKAEVAPTFLSMIEVCLFIPHASPVIA